MLPSGVTLNLATLTLEDVVGWLRAAEDRAKADDEVLPEQAAGRLYLTEEQWEARRREHREKERVRSRGARQGEGGKKAGRSGGLEDDIDGDDGGNSVHSCGSG